MKIKLIGFGTIGLCTLLLLWNWSKYAEIYYILEAQEDYFRLKHYLVPIACGALYLSIFNTGLLFGLDLIKQTEGGRSKKKKMAFLFTIIVWLILALPLYKCEFYNVRHTFWESQDGHFH